MRSAVLVEWGISQWFARQILILNNLHVENMSDSNIGDPACRNWL